jgi:hypothetical protein
MDDVSRPAEVHDHRYRSGCKSFKNYTRPVVANGWKHKHIRRSQARKDVCMAEPPAKGNILFDAKRSHKLLEAVSFRAVADHSKAGQIVFQ